MKNFDDNDDLQTLLIHKEEFMNTGYEPQLTLKEIGTTISHLGVKKANTKLWQLLLLGLLAGIYISFGGHLFLVALDQGLGRIIASVCFSLGLILVVIAGAELFTGNIIMIVGAITSLYSPLQLLRNWAIVYIGNFLGSLFVALLVFQSHLLGVPARLNSLGQLAVKVETAKIALTFGECFIRGFFCNILVILAIIMSYFPKDIISKIFCIIFPIAAFVASGFEHCVANMYLIPLGLFASVTPLSQFGAMFHNIIPVTLGNIVGGLFILVIHPNRIRQIGILISRKKSDLS
jgi:formate/nitrite transporter